jgi:hypothetical protein
MEQTTGADLNLPADRMPEAEVALRLADHLLSLPGSGSMASVAINGASVRIGDRITFDIDRFMAQTGWDRIKASQVGRTAWTGAYSRGGKAIRVHSRPGEGDVIAHVNGRRIVAKCKKGPLIRKAGSPEYPLLIMALGQTLLFDVASDDIVVAAVPDTAVFRTIADQWRSRPLVKRIGIQIALVSRDGAVSGLKL